MSGIRLGDLPDMTKIVELGMELLENSDYHGIKPDKLKFRKLVGSMMVSKRGRVWVVVDDDDKPQGFLLGMVDELFFSRSMYATDIAVYIREGYRQHAFKLYKNFIDWALLKPKVVDVSLAKSSGIIGLEEWEKLMEYLGLHKVGSLYSAKRV